MGGVCTDNHIDKLARLVFITEVSDDGLASIIGYEHQKDVLFIYGKLNNPVVPHDWFPRLGVLCDIKS